MVSVIAGNGSARGNACLRQPPSSEGGLRRCRGRANTEVTEETRWVCPMAASISADSAHDSRDWPCVDRVAAELFHDRIVIVRQRLHWLSRLHLHDFVAVCLELDEQFWQLSLIH